MPHAVEKIREILIANLVRLRKERGISQEQLAERANLNARYVSFVETGRRWPKAETVEAFARGLEVHSGELFRTDLTQMRPGPREAWEIVGEFIDAELSKKKTTE